jgi:23S rRNA (adenine2503-C2)-methyltransferase
MGMGEPLLALETVGPALQGLLDQRRFEIAPRYLSLSTCGVTPEIPRFVRDFPRIKLAVSLHAPRQDLRDRLMPGCRSWPLGGLMSALDGYAGATGHQLFFEYIMMAGVNDGVREAEELTELLRGRRAHVNLIPYNAAAGGGSASSRAVLDFFQTRLAAGGTSSTVRHSAGETIAAACGQLAGKEPSGNSNGRASPTVEANTN